MSQRITKIRKCVNPISQHYMSRTTARQAGVTSTPSFVLARTDLTNPTLVSGLSFIRGAQPFSRFKALIDSALLDCVDGEDCADSPD